MSNQTAEMDLSGLEALLGGTLDAMADKPSWEVFPTGAHQCLMSMKLFQIDIPALDAKGNKTNQKVKATGVKVTFKAIKTLELAEPVGNEDAAKELNPGDANTVDLFFTHTSEMATRVGQGTFKEIAAKLNERFGLRNNLEVIEQTQDVEVVLFCKRRAYVRKDTKELTHNLVIEQIELI